MKLLLKILRIAAVTIFIVMAVLFIAAQVMQEKVAEIIINSINRNISTKLEASSYRLSYIKKFPLASLELKDVVVHSSQRFDKDAFGALNTDTLLAASVVSVEFRILDVISGNYSIERIGAKSGLVHLYTDRSGKVNYEITEKSENPDTDVFSLDLKKIYLTDISTTYNNLSANLLLEGNIDEGTLKIGITGENIDLLASGKITIEGFHLNNTHMTSPIAAGIDLSLLSNEKGVTFRKGTMKIDNYDFSVEGIVGSDDYIDLKITGNNVSIAAVRNYLPEKYNEYLSRYDPKGILVISSTVKGLSNQKSNPHIEATCRLEKGRIGYGSSKFSIETLSFYALFTNGSLNRQETSSLTVKDFSMTIGSAGFSGSFFMTDFNNPRAELVLRGKIIPAEIKDFFGIEAVSHAGGNADIDLRLATDNWPSGNLSLSSLLSLNPVADIRFNSFSLGLNHDSVLLRNITGDVAFAETSRTAGLDFNYNGQQIRLNGDFSNLPGWIAGNGSVLICKGRADFSRFIPEIFLAWGGEKDSTAAVDLPYDIIADMRFSIDTLEYGRFFAEDITGALVYKPKLLTFNSLNFKAINGSISGTGFLLQNANGSFLSKGSYSLNGIDINKAFVTFRNFGQDFIKAENLSGKLSGSISVLLPMDSLLVPDKRSVTAEGKYLVSNGALVDFEPIKELSSFIELSELENIKFEELENDFFIRNNKLSIPQMDVRSSAADLSVNGIHSFDNDYEYHVKIRLSELLSGKRRRNSGPVTEFGAVEDDGLGRTSILLKIEGNDDDLKVAYDFKAASAGVKSNMKKEKENLKSILNQEYGWFNSDSAATAKPAEKKQRFRITWDEGAGSKNTEAPPPEEKKEEGFKSLFKKKGGEN